MSFSRNSIDVDGGLIRSNTTTTIRILSQGSGRSLYSVCLLATHCRRIQSVLPAVHQKKPKWYVSANLRHCHGNLWEIGDYHMLRSFAIVLSLLFVYNMVFNTGKVRWSRLNINASINLNLFLEPSLGLTLVPVDSQLGSIEDDAVTH